jgi:DNA-directed RNA polymerase I, II, and III subunit RPABC2
MEESYKFVSDVHQDVGFPNRKEVSQSLGSSDRKSVPYMTKYEKTKLVSARVQQLSHGAPPLTSVDGLDSDNQFFLHRVAEKEILEQKLPYIISRKFPNFVEYWSAQELQIL